MEDFGHRTLISGSDSPLDSCTPLSSSAQNTSDTSLKLLKMELDIFSNDIMERDYVCEDDTAPSESEDESEGEINESQLRDLLQAVTETTCTPDDGSRTTTNGANLVRDTVKGKLQEAEKPEFKCTSLLNSNAKIQNYYRNALKTVEEGIDILNKKLVESREELRLRKYQTTPNPLLEKLPSYPYFKDNRKFTAPLNADTLKKRTTEGFNFQRLPSTIKWQKWEMKLLDLSVRKEVFLSLEQPLACRKQLLENQLKKKTGKGLPAKKTRRLLNAINKDIDALTSESMFEILYNAEDANIDWMKISTTHFKGKRSPEECEGMWITNQNLKINRLPWTKEEIDRLVLIAKNHDNQDWDKIAEIVGNGRSAFQCALYQQLHLNHERAKWSPAADKQLTALVKKHTKKGIINFEKIANEMPGRTTKQVRRRWTDTIDPQIRKGSFTKTEDTIISTARFYHKLNFRQIARLLPGRTPNQLRCRYTRLEFVNPIHPWCLTEDEKLLHLMKNNKQRNWNYMVKHFNDRNLQQLRARYHRLRSDAKRAGKKLMLLNPNYDPNDKEQVAQNYVPDYDKEHNEKTMKYVPVTSLMKMVNRKGRRGKRSKKPDVIDKEIAMFYRNYEHFKNRGRDRKNYNFQTNQKDDEDEKGNSKKEDEKNFIESSIFYTEALSANLDWLRTEESVKNTNMCLYKDLQVDGVYKVMQEFRSKHDNTGWDPSNTDVKYLLPPSIASFTGMRSLMLQKPIQEALNEQSSSEDEKENRMEVNTLMKEATEKLNSSTASEIPLSSTPSNLENSGDNISEQENEQNKTLQMLLELKNKIEAYANNANNNPSSSPTSSSSENQGKNNQLTPPSTSPESNPVTNVTPCETNSFLAVHSAIPRGLKYKYECLTPKNAFKVYTDTDKPKLPVVIEETCLKNVFTKYYKLHDKSLLKHHAEKDVQHELIEDETEANHSMSEVKRETNSEENMELKEENDTMTNVPTSGYVKEHTEQLTEAVIKDNDIKENKLDAALKLWLQRFVSIFYLPGIMSMVEPTPKFQEDIFDGKRMTSKDSDELDTSSDSDYSNSSLPYIQRIHHSRPLAKSSTIMSEKTETEKKKKDSAKPEVNKFDLDNPPMPESERKKLLLAKWLKYRNYKIRELEERKRKGLKDEWEEEQARLQAIDQEANKELFERIPGKRGRPRRLRRRKRTHLEAIEALNKHTDDEENTHDETSLFLQPASPENSQDTHTASEQSVRNMEASISLSEPEQKYDPSIDNDSE